MSEHDELTTDQALELLRQHHADGDDFGTDAAITIKRAQNEIDRLRTTLEQAELQRDEARRRECCPACSTVVRNLSACAHSLVTHGATPVRIDDLRRAVAAFQPYVDAHFSDREHSHGEATEVCRGLRDRWLGKDGSKWEGE